MDAQAIANIVGDSLHPVGGLLKLFDELALVIGECGAAQELGCAAHQRERVS